MMINRDSRTSGRGRRGALAVVTCAATMSLPVTATWAADHGLSAETRKQLAEVRAATARYHDIRNALADGYVDIGFDPPGVGCHLLNPGLVDGTFEVARPEALIYADCSGELGGRSELRAVEWIVPGPTCGVPVPDGLAGDADVWEVFVTGDGCDLWTLHAWVWRRNPDGILTKLNPRVP